MSLDAALADQKDEPFFTNWKVNFKEDSLDIAKSSLAALVSPIVHSDSPRTGVISYAYSISEQHRDNSLRKNCVYFTELFTDLESYQNHLTEAEAEPVVQLFKSIKSRIVGYVNTPVWHEGIKASIIRDQVQVARTTHGHALNPYPKSLRGGKYGRKVLAEAKKAVMLELRVHPSSKQDSKRLLELLLPLTKIHKSDISIISAYIIQGPGWWRRAPETANVSLKTRDAKIPEDCYSTEFGSSDTIEFRVIYNQSLGVRHKFQRSFVSELVKILGSSVASEFVVTAEDLQDEALVDLLEYFDDNGLITSDRRSLLAGFLLHPYYTKSWDDKIEGKKHVIKASLNSALANRFGKINVKKSTSNQRVKDQNNNLGDIFRIRRHAVKDQPEALVLESGARTRKSSQRFFHIALIDFLRTITRLGHSDKEVPIGTIFGVLERMRSMAQDVAYINDLGNLDEDERERVGNSTRVQKIFMKLSLMGMGGFTKEFGRKSLCIDGLNELISVIEKEYAVVVDQAKTAVSEGGSIAYLGLQELYKIGSVVTTRSIPGLGGLLTSLKVVDCVYEPIRSLMGSLRYSFRVTFETIMFVGQHFIAIPFTEMFGEWKNAKDINSLPFSPLQKDNNGHHCSWVGDRLKMLNILRGDQESFSYMEYPAGSFFPSLGGRKNKSSGAASSSVMRVAPGQVIVDVKTGLNLGYAPCSRVGSLGTSMAMITKVYLDYLRKSSNDNVNLDEMNNENAGLFTAFDSFPSGINAQPWPCVVAFSMSTKSWGYAIVDRLIPVLPDPRPWSELVLPVESKEMLMSLVKTKIQQPAKSRYSYQDVIAGKGAGGLYLLYGPPGTGKTLTVEALARFFGKPLYSISFAELGSTTAELEEKLTVTLQLAAHWGCLALLDEGDALVEKRKQGQLLLNSMTGVLLRLLETFEGSLFINSNRVASFDPAALSRVTLAVKFSPLAPDGMRQVWRNTIARVLKSDTTRSLTYDAALDEVSSDFDLEALETFKGSGRSIGAVMKMAIALCSHRECKLTQGIISECIANFMSFHKDFSSQGVKEDWTEET